MISTINQIIIPSTGHNYMNIYNVHKLIDTCMKCMLFMSLYIIIYACYYDLDN